jgi:hypothetical protein
MYHLNQSSKDHTGRNCLCLAVLAIAKSLVLLDLVGVIASQIGADAGSNGVTGVFIEHFHRVIESLNICQFFKFGHIDSVVKVDCLTDRLTFFHVPVNKLTIEVVDSAFSCRQDCIAPKGIENEKFLACLCPFLPLQAPDAVSSIRVISGGAV